MISMSQKNLIQAFLLLVINFAFIRLNAQTYTLGTSPATNNAVINTCSGTFYDSGGSGADYGNNQNTTVTFCSNNTKQMVMNFASFNLEGGSCENDYLKIYDGNSTAATLIGTFCGTNNPGIITASGTCLTVQFVSNGSTVGTGWQAALSCYECIDNNTCATQYIDLDFSDNSIQKTLDPTGWVGDEWRFDNVYTGTYAKVKIVGVQNVATAAVSTIDNATQPFPAAWSPELGFNIVSGQDSYVDWEVTFYDNTTNAVKPLPKASRVTSYDVDGPTNRNPYTELHGHTSPDGYILGSTSQLSVLNEAPRTIILGTPTEYTGISDNDFSKVTFYYSDSLTVFNIRLGIRAATGASGSVPARQYALGFVACPDFDNPVVNPIIPTITGVNDICINGTLTQTYSLPNNFSNIVWTATGGTITAGQGTQTVTVQWPATAGNYKIAVVTTDGTSCVVNNSRSVTVYPIANVNAGSDLTICTSSSPSAITLSGASFSGSATTAAWSVISGGGSLSSTAQTGTPATVTYTPPTYIPANGNYSIDVTLQLLTNDPAGPCPAVSDTRIISVNYLVGGTITGAQTICIDGDPSVIGN